MKHVSGKLNWKLDIIMLVGPFQLKIFYGFMGAGFCFAAITALSSNGSTMLLSGSLGRLWSCWVMLTTQHMWASDTSHSLYRSICVNFHHSTSQLGPPQKVLYSPKFTKANIQRQSWYHYMQLDTHVKEKPLHHKRKAGHITAPGKLTFVCLFVIWNAQSYLLEMFLFTWLPPQLDQG